MNCRFCGRELSHVFVDLGTAPPSNSFLAAEQLDGPEIYYPLKVFVCDECFLVQIDEYKKSTEIFSEDYVYFSSMSRTWLEHSRAYVEWIIPRLGLGGASFVVELASNDGYLLQYFRQCGVPCLGVEPTHSTAEAARRKGIEVVEDFFGVRLAETMVGRGLAADLVIGNNVLAHVPDLNDFVEGIRILLKPGGTVTLEFPHILQLIQHSQFDTIYHEHFSYFSFTTVCSVLRRHGLEVYDVQELPTHGGSLRVHAAHMGSSRATTRSCSMEALLAVEAAAGICTMACYAGFQEKVERVKLGFVEFLLDARRRGKRVAGYGAAAKGNTLLNYCGVRADLLCFVVDAAMSKQGHFLPGSRIPVVAEEALRSERPDYVVVFPWNLVEEVRAQIGYVYSWGGALVRAVPRLEILPADG